MQLQISKMTTSYDYFCISTWMLWRLFLFIKIRLTYFLWSHQNLMWFFSKYIRCSTLHKNIKVKSNNFAQKKLQYVRSNIDRETKRKIVFPYSSHWHKLICTSSILNKTQIKLFWNDNNLISHFNIKFTNSLKGRHHAFYHNIASTK